jgi:hypothetical protein
MSGEELDLGQIEAQPYWAIEDIAALLAEVKRLRKKVRTSKREMLDLLEQRLLIGPSDYDRMVVELETGVSDWD